MRRTILMVTAILLLFSAAEPMGQGFKKRVVFLPFYDESGYRGPWELSYQIPEVLGDMLGGADEYFEVVPMDTVRKSMPTPKEPNIFSKVFGLFRNKKSVVTVMTDSEILSVARRLGADYAITGLIENFNMNRTGGGDPMVGGYKSYTTKVKVEQVRVLRVNDGRPLGTVRGEENKSSRGLGLELFGKPRQMDLEFISMDSLDFGSKRFLGTMWGQTTIEALNKVNKELRTVIAKPDTNWYASKNFRVISIDAGNAIINAGSADGVLAGDKFLVFASESGTKVGKINIMTVWSDHVSQAEIIEGRDEIRPNDTIRPEL